MYVFYAGGARIHTEEHGITFIEFVLGNNYCWIKLAEYVILII